ncbi:TIGR02206 family membrane protein [Algibacter sp. 2305UL17-15]|uniref:YwaF family protein n=1 Tax=Algibacter sp. 2305UL17-15 TaxID=3231268 RepID=UPI0034598B8D
MDFFSFDAIFLCARVAVGSLQHLIPIVVALLFCVVFINFAKYKLHKKQQELAIHLVAWFISLSVLVFHIYYILKGNYDVATDLPLYLCSLLGLLIPIFTHYRKLWMYEILLFWIIAGTFQGVITPDIAEGFPSFDFFRYWIVHLGLLTVIFYATFVFNMRPKLKSVFKSFLALQLYVILMILGNYLLDANYFYLNEKPESASLLDYFGAWPWYVILAQIVVIPYFLLIYLPFYVVERRKK